MSLIEVSRRLSVEMDGLRFHAPVEFVYNPLDYAREPHEAYLSRFGNGAREILLVGMNPGPFGMAQTGVPFGEVAAVRDWLGIEAEVGKPDRAHPKRPVEGFACGRSEVSGRRLWGWAQSRFGTPARFFHRFFVWNYCPLLFLAASGRNLTPDTLSAEDRAALFGPCDRALEGVLKRLRPRWVVGVGQFAEGRARGVVEGISATGVRGEAPPTVGRILHPSPASPAANRGWAEAAEADFRRLGISME
jgi:single-strand selective monofunctional uracil DNA glycosylase